MPTQWDQLRVQLGLTTRNVWDPASPRRDTWYRWPTDLTIWYVPAGRGWMRTRGGRVTLKRGVCLCLAPGWDYDAAHDTRDPLTHYSLHFTLHDAATNRLLPLDHRVIPEVLRVPDPDCTGAVMERLVNLTRGMAALRPDSHPDRIEIANHLFKAILMDLCAASSETRAVDPGTQQYQYQKMVGVARRLTENPSEVPPITELARQAGYTLPHFSRVFKHHIGKSPKAFLLELRVDVARQWLMESDLTINQIARRLGFESLPYFSRLFRAKMGVSPSEFRRRSRPGG